MPSRSPVYWAIADTGIHAVAVGAGHDHSEDEIRYVRRRYLSCDTAEAVAIGIANATFAVRRQGLWGEGSTAVASDSTHFRSYDQNLFTEWHSADQANQHVRLYRPATR